MGAHLVMVNGEQCWQSDKYPTCPPGKVPLSVKDKAAQPYLWAYAQEHRAIDAEFSDDLEVALRAAGFDPYAWPGAFVRHGTTKTARDRLDAMRIGLDMKLERCNCGAFATRYTRWLWKNPTPPLPVGMVTNTCDECEPIRPADIEAVRMFSEGILQAAKTARRLNAIAWDGEDK